MITADKEEPGVFINVVFVKIKNLNQVFDSFVRGDTTNVENVCFVRRQKPCLLRGVLFLSILRINGVTTGLSNPNLISSSVLNEETPAASFTLLAKSGSFLLLHSAKRRRFWGVWFKKRSRSNVVVDQ